MRSASWLMAGLFVGSCAASGSALAAGGTATDQAVKLTYAPTHWGAQPAASLDGIGAADQLASSGWWYRIEGDAREFPLPAPDGETYLDGKIEATWNDLDGKGFKVVEVTWAVDTERPSGGFLTWIRAWNTRRTAQQITLFHYLDVNLGPDAAGDSAARVNGRFLKLSDGATVASYKAAGATHFQVATDVRAALNDDNADTLDDSGLPFGPGDVTAAYQYGPVTVPPAALTAGWVSLVVTPAPSAQDDSARAVADGHVKGDFLGVLPYPALYGQALAPASDVATQLFVPMRRTTQLLGFTRSPAPASSSFAGIDDFDGDFKDEVVSRDAATGAAFVAGQPIADAPTLPLNWKLSATGDFNQDGKADILWRNTISQKLVIWTMNGAAKTGSIVPSPDQAANANWEVAGAADFNGDGNRDLLWYNQTTGKIVLWYLDAAQVRITGLFTTPDGVGSNAWRVVAVGDFGRGPGGQYGTQDIVWQNDVSHKVVVWHMDGAATRTAGVFTTPDVLGGGAHQVVGPR